MYLLETGNKRNMPWNEQENVYKFHLSGSVVPTALIKFLKIGQISGKNLRRKHSARTPVDVGILFMRIHVGILLERTRQTTVGAILVNSHMRPQPYVC